jgi:hypothetical protein
VQIKKITVELDRTWVLAVGVSMAAPLVNETTEASLSMAKIFTPVRTGNLRAGNRKTMRATRTTVRGTVENRIKYARWVHEGTRAHLIRARRAKFLRFSYDGQVIFRRVVRHPGTKGQPFLYMGVLIAGTRHGFKVTRGPGLIVKAIGA